MLQGKRAYRARVDFWMLAALRKAGREPTMAQWRIAMWILAAGGLIVVVTLIVMLAS